MSERLRVEGERFTHKDLWRTARWFLRRGATEERGSFHTLLAATLFSYLAFEAYLNAVLEDVAPDVWRDERRFFSQGEFRGTLGKYQYLAQWADHALDKSRRPFQTVREVASARDALAHARTEAFDEVVDAQQLEDAQPVRLRLQRYAETAFAQRAIEDIEAASDALHAALVARRGGMIAGSQVGAFAGIDESWTASMPEGDA